MVEVELLRVVRVGPLGGLWSGASWNTTSDDVSFFVITTHLMNRAGFARTDQAPPMSSR